MCPLRPQTLVVNTCEGVDLQHDIQETCLLSMTCSITDRHKEYLQTVVDSVAS